MLSILAFAEKPTDFASGTSGPDSVLQSSTTTAAQQAAAVAALQQQQQQQQPPSQAQNSTAVTNNSSHPQTPSPSLAFGGVPTSLQQPAASPLPMAQFSQAQSAQPQQTYHPLAALNSAQQQQQRKMMNGPSLPGGMLPMNQNQVVQTSTAFLSTMLFG